MKIVGGLAARNTVSLYSDQFTATARLQKDGTITSTCKPRNRLQKFLAAHPYVPPRFIAFSLLILSNLGKRTLLIAGALILTISTLFVFTVLYMGGEHPEENLEVVNDTMPLTRPFLLLLGFWIYNRYAAGFHAAEHMVTNAYEKYGDVGVEMSCLSSQSRVHDSCGSRLMVPAFTIALFLLVAVPLFGEVVLFISLLLWEGMLWVDALVGLQHIPIFAKASTLMQQRVTTKTPTDAELRTGQEALKALLRAHNP